MTDEYGEVLGSYLIWEDGRKLSRIETVVPSNEGNYTYDYTYNADGIRTSKTYLCEYNMEGYRIEYVVDGSRIISETKYTADSDFYFSETYTIVYIYDELGSPIGMMYRTPSYAQGVYDCFFFDKNLQGDIVGVYNASGTKVVSYTYDAWGNCTESYPAGYSAASAAMRNPFRYRGYYYDAETEWYYLQTRYYNPAWGRFINADEYVNANGDIIGFNMFAYCSNNPVMYKDPVGTLSIVSVIALVVTGVVVLAMIIALNNEENNVVEEVIDVAKDGLEVVGEVNDKAEAVNTAINILDFAILLNTIYTSAEDFNKNQYVHITNVIGRARNPQYMVVYPNNMSKEEYDKHLMCDMQWYFDQAVGIREFRDAIDPNVPISDIDIEALWSMRGTNSYFKSSYITFGCELAEMGWEYVY